MSSSFICLNAEQNQKHLEESRMSFFIQATETKNEYKIKRLIHNNRKRLNDSEFLVNDFQLMLTSVY